MNISEGRALYLRGKIGRCITSDSDSSALAISGPIDIYRNLLLGDLTVEFWILFKNNVSADIVIGYNGNRGMLYGAIRIQPEPDIGAIYIEYNTGDSHGENFKLNETGYTIPIDTWAHYALVKEGNEIRVYINGRLIFNTSNVQVSQLGNDRNQMIIFLNYATQLDEFKISDTAKYKNNFTPSGK